MNFNIPSGVEFIMRTLNTAGFEAYLVGGCVRDMLRGCEPHDWDICTSALPTETIQCFSNHRVIKTGLKHGAITVVINNKSFEVTTYRIDGKYSDGRRPDNVLFVSSIQEDLSRRDFTVNAIAMDIDGNIVDPFSGMQDIADRVIRCVGSPDYRFQEDGLRTMRAMRFASVLGYSIDPKTAQSIHSNKEMLAHVAAERIHTELCKFLLGDGAQEILREYIDVLCVFWPELRPMQGMEQHNPGHIYDVWEHTILAVQSAP